MFFCVFGYSLAHCQLGTNISVFGHKTEDSVFGLMCVSCIILFPKHIKRLITQGVKWTLLLSFFLFQGRVCLSERREGQLSPTTTIKGMWWGREGHCTTNIISLSSYHQKQKKGGWMHKPNNKYKDNLAYPSPETRWCSSLSWAGSCCTHRRGTPGYPAASPHSGTGH